MRASFARTNGDRSCINSGAIVVPKHTAALADALGWKLGSTAPTWAQSPVVFVPEPCEDRFRGSRLQACAFSMIA